MPRAAAIEDDASGRLAAADGHAFPPSICAERGGSPSEIARSLAHDFIIVFHALSRVAKRVA